MYPERFRPLHDFALTLLAQLHASFDVDRIEGYGVDNELEGGDLARAASGWFPAIRQPHLSRLRLRRFPDSGFEPVGGAQRPFQRAAAMPAMRPRMMRRSVSQK